VVESKQTDGGGDSHSSHPFERQGKDRQRQGQAAWQHPRHVRHQRSRAASACGQKLRAKGLYRTYKSAATSSRAFDDLQAER
jgi:hypothetical protein